MDVLFFRPIMSKWSTFSPSWKRLLLPLTVFLLSARATDGRQNVSQAAVKSSSQGNAMHITAKEGSSKLIRCNLTGGHDGVEWYNAQGRLQGKEDISDEKDCELSSHTASVSSHHRVTPRRSVFFR